MALVLARIDDRLIHGQVVVGWVKHLEANCIVVANDAIAADPMQRALLPMAVPPEIQVEIYKVAEAARKLAGGVEAGKRTILLFSSPMDALRFLKQGGALESLNLGGLRFAPGKTQVLKSISLGREDLEALRQLREAGTGMSVQMVPSDPAVDVLKILPGGEHG